MENVPNTLLILKTKDKRVFAGFSSLSYSTGLYDDSITGLLMLINDKITFKLNKDRPPVQKDSKLLIFGNRDIVFNH